MLSANDFIFVQNKRIVKSTFQKTSGYSLLIASALLILTMSIHPIGGSLEHIQNMQHVFVFSHGLAIFCLPFIAFGFYGLTCVLSDDRKFSLLAFIILITGLIAAMFAGLTNGILIPNFVSNHLDDSNTNFNTVELIVKFGFEFNKALDYILVAAISAAILIWSILMQRSIVYPRWLGLLGGVLFVLFLVGWHMGFNYSSLWGFRIFIFMLVGWICFAGGYMIRSGAKSK
jgi:hypothetical protein